MEKGRTTKYFNQDMWELGTVCRVNHCTIHQMRHTLLVAHLCKKSKVSLQMAYDIHLSCSYSAMIKAVLYHRYLKQ
jgi:hypothetical protein